MAWLRPKNEGKQNIKTEKCRIAWDRTPARPCTNARPCVHQRTAMRPYSPAALFYLECTAVHPYRTPVPCAVFLYFAILNAQGFLEPLIFLEITFKVLFSIETRGYLLK